VDDAFITVGERCELPQRRRHGQRPSLISFNLDVEDRSRLRVSQFGAHWRDYAGAMLLRHWQTRTARRNLIRSGTRSQCRSRSSGEMWSYFRLSHTNRAASLSTHWCRLTSWPDTPATVVLPQSRRDKEVRRRCASTNYNVSQNVHHFHCCNY